MNLKNILLSLIAILMLAMTTAWAMQGGAKEVKIKMSDVPAAVAQTVKTECPDCAIDKLTREVENGVTIYDFEFKGGQGEMDVTQDGLVVSRETVVRMDDIPTPARDAILQGAEKGRVAQVLKEEVRAELTDGKVTKLDTPKYFYEADLVKGNEVAEIVVSPEGQVIEAPVWRKRGAKEN
jgi:hypothetical protein